MQRIMCEANNVCARDAPDSGYLFCQLGTYVDIRLSFDKHYNTENPLLFLTDTPLDTFWKSRLSPHWTLTPKQDDRAALARAAPRSTNNATSSKQYFTPEEELHAPLFPNLKRL